MLERLLPVALFRAHWKGLSFYRDDAARADIATRVVLVALPVISGIAMWVLAGRLLAPAAVLTGLALLAGGLVAAFGQLSTLRLRLTERMTDEHDGQRTDRDFLDETAAHLLTAAYGAAVTAAVLALGMNFALDAEGALTGSWAAVATALAAWVVLVFLVAIPRMYEAYANINKVRDVLSGTHRGRGRR